MGKEIITFGDNEIEKHKITAMKIQFLEDVDIDNMLISGKISSVAKNYRYFSGFISKV